MKPIIVAVFAGLASAAFQALGNQDDELKKLVKKSTARKIRDVDYKFGGNINADPLSADQVHKSTSAVDFDKATHSSVRVTPDCSSNGRTTSRRLSTSVATFDSDYPTNPAEGPDCPCESAVSSVHPVSGTTHTKAQHTITGTHKTTTPTTSCTLKSKTAKGVTSFDPPPPSGLPRSSSDTDTDEVTTIMTKKTLTSTKWASTTSFSTKTAKPSKTLGASTKSTPCPCDDGDGIKSVHHSNDTTTHSVTSAIDPVYGSVSATLSLPSYVDSIAGSVTTNMLKSTTGGALSSSTLPTTAGVGNVQPGWYLAVSAIILVATLGGDFF